MKPIVKEFLKIYGQALKENNAAVFAGAGLSKPAGFVDWKGLMREIAENLGLDVDQETDLIAVAQYHINERLGNRSIINQEIINNFVKDAELTENHKILARLPITSYWTTNYDSLIEESIKEAGKTADKKVVSENILTTIPKRDAVVYKMHGDISQPNEAIIAKEDYETYELKRNAYSIVLQSELLSKTFLFIGFSFDDPNLIYILTRIKNMLGDKANALRTHYFFIKKENSPEKIIKQDLKIKDLNRYGIKAIVVDDFDEITEILKYINSFYRRSNVFVSGAAEEFEKDNLNESYHKRFIHDLSKSVVKNDFKIISGVGYTVGSGVINGVLDYIFTTNYRCLDEYIILRPFPQYFFSDNELNDVEIKLYKKERNIKYRRSMIQEAGVAIFIYGNKKNKETDSITDSNGMMEEFDEAIKLGVKPIPIGATGYTAKKIWLKVVENFDDYYKCKDNPKVLEELRNLLNEIGDDDKFKKETSQFDYQDQIIQKVIQIIQKINITTTLL